jgi:hypothetical protein
MALAPAQQPSYGAAVTERGCSEPNQMTSSLVERLRRSPSQSSVAGSLPVLFFGDLFIARVATVGLNPSHQEYLDRRGNELDGELRRFETLNSLRALDRASLSAEQCGRAIATMRTYFQPGKPVYSWFRSLDRVVRGFGVSYDLGEVAHLDLVQEATQPTWSGLPLQELAQLRAADQPFLYWQMETFPLEVVICNGRSVFTGVQTLTNARIVQSGKLARVTWYVALSAMPGRVMGVVGWNIPLARPAGLDKAGHTELGRLLSQRLEDVIEVTNPEERAG